MVKYPIRVKIEILRLCAYLLAVFSWRFLRTLLTSKQWHTAETTILNVNTLALIYHLVLASGNPCRDRHSKGTQNPSAARR